MSVFRYSQGRKAKDRFAKLRILPIDPRPSGWGYQRWTAIVLRKSVAVSVIKRTRFDHAMLCGILLFPV